MEKPDWWPLEAHGIVTPPVSVNWRFLSMGLSRLLSTSSVSMSELFLAFKYRCVQAQRKTGKPCVAAYLPHLPFRWSRWSLVFSICL